MTRPVRMPADLPDASPDAAESAPLVAAYDEALRRTQQGRTQQGPSGELVAAEAHLNPDFAATLRLLHTALREPDPSASALTSRASTPAFSPSHQTLSLRKRDHVRNSSQASHGEGRRNRSSGEFPPLPARFRCIRPLGHGSFGTVYLADDLRLNRQVAIKVPNSSTLNSPELRQRFLRESRAHGRLNHANIVRVLDAGTEDHILWQATEFVEGGSLRDLITSSAGHMSARDVARIMWCLADAVHHAHQEGVLHRDIKPENILMDEGTSETQYASSRLLTPRLTDFGLARLVDDDVQLSRSGDLIGTPKYMSPEQMSGDVAAIDQRTDLYSLGVVFYELLTGQVPFPQAQTLASRTLMGRLPVPRTRLLRPNVPRDLDTICLKCLSPMPADRFQTAMELRDELARFLERRPTLSRPAPWHEQLRLWSARNPTIASSLILVSLAATVFMIQMWQNTHAMDRQNAELLKTTERLQSEMQRSAELLVAAEQSSRMASQHESEYQRLAMHRTAQSAFFKLQQADYSTTRLLLQRADEEFVSLPPAPEAALIRSELRNRFRIVLDAGYPLRAMAAVPETTLLVLGGDSNQLIIFDRSRRSIVRTIDTPIPAIHAVAVSADGQSIAAGGVVGDADVSVPILISRHTGQITRTFPQQLTTIESLAFSPDGSKLICGARYEPVAIFDLTDASVPAISIPSDRRNEWFAFDVVQNRIGVLASSQQVTWTDLNSGQQVDVTDFSTGRSCGVMIPGSALLACAQYNQFGIDVVDIRNGQPLCKLMHAGKSFRTVSAGPSNGEVFGGRIDGGLVRWKIPAACVEAASDLTSQSDVRPIEVEPEFLGRFHQQGITEIFCTEHRIWCCSQAGTVSEIQLPMFSEEDSPPEPAALPWHSVAVDPGTGQGYCGTFDGKIDPIAGSPEECQAYADEVSRRYLQCNEKSLAGHCPIVHLEFSEQGSRLAWADWRSRVFTADSTNVSSGEALAENVVDSWGTTSFLNRSPDGRWLIWGGYDSCLWIADQQRTVATRAIALPLVPGVAQFSPDNSQVACGGRASELVIVNLESETEAGRVPNCTDCSALAWGPTKDSLFAGFSDGSISLIKGGGQLEYRRVLHRSRVCEIRLVTGTPLAVSVDETAEVAVWLRETGELLGILYAPRIIPALSHCPAPALELMDDGRLVLAYYDIASGPTTRTWHIR